MRIAQSRGDGVNPTAGDPDRPQFRQPFIGAFMTDDLAYNRQQIVIIGDAPGIGGETFIPRQVTAPDMTAKGLPKNRQASIHTCYRGL